MRNHLKLQCIFVGLLTFASPIMAQTKVEVVVAWNAFVRSATAKNPEFNVQLMANGDNPNKVTFKVPSEHRLAFWTSLKGRVSDVTKIDLGMNFFLTDGLEELMKAHGISTIGVSLQDDDRVVIRVYGTESRWLGDLVYDQKSVAAEAAYLKASLVENNNQPNKAKMATPRKPSD